MEYISSLDKAYSLPTQGGRVCILGSTGSIGRTTLKVIEKKKEIFSAKNAIEDALNILKAQLKNYNISFEIRGEEFKINGYQNEFKQVILNIISNAKDAILEKKIKETLSIQVKIIYKLYL